MAENKNLYTVADHGEAGSVRVDEDVLAIIAALAATEVDGVSSVNGSASREKIPKKTAKALSKGARVHFEEGKLMAEIVINIDYGYNIPDISRDVQERVKNAIESMTGIEVAQVDVSVAGVAMEKEA